METYHKISTPFKRDMDGSVTGQKGKLILGDWARPEFEYLADNEWEFTEKVDGTNIRVGLTRYRNHFETDVQFAGRSDNAVIPPPLLWALHGCFGDATANKKVTDWMIDNSLDSVTLFGEGYGPKIQGGGKYRDDHSFVLFDVKIGDFWLDRANVNDIASKLGIESVPVLGTGTLWEAIAFVHYGTPYRSVEIDRFKIMAESDPGLLERLRKPMNSRWGNFEAEGIVARPVVPLFNRKGERIITKIKAVDFR